MVASPDTALSKPNVYESKRIQLTSPILHIGSEVSRLNPFEYVQTSSKVYIPSQEALVAAIQKRGRLKDYIRIIEQREDIQPLLKNIFGDNWWEAKLENEELIFSEITSSQKWTEEKITDLRPMIRNGMGQLYIPGSSIKGAIRTAIAYHLLKHAERYQVPQANQLSEIEQKLRNQLGELKRQAKFADDKLFMNILFSDFSLSYQGKTVRCKAESPNTDFMRAVQVTDATPLLKQNVTVKGKVYSANTPIVAEVIVSSHFPDGKAKYRGPIYAEMVFNARSQFTISIDQTMLSWFRHNQGMQIPFQNIDDILQICQEFAQEQWDYEHDYWQEVKNNPKAQGRNLDFSYIQDFYEAENCPYTLRVGWGSGMTGTTIGLLLKDDLRAEIRDACGIAAPNFEAPKSRRTVMAKSGEIKYVPGWVKFKPC